MRHPVVTDVLALAAATAGFTNEDLEQVGRRRQLLPLLRRALVGLRDFDRPPRDAIERAERAVEDKSQSVLPLEAPGWPGYEPAIPPLSNEWRMYEFHADDPDWGPRPLRGR